MNGVLSDTLTSTKDEHDRLEARFVANRSSFGDRDASLLDEVKSFAARTAAAGQTMPVPSVRQEFEWILEFWTSTVRAHSGDSAFTHTLADFHEAAN